MQEYAYPFRAVAFSPDGNTLAASSSDHTIRLWNVYTSDSIISLHGPTKPIVAITFSPDGATLAGGSDDHKVWLWDIHNGQQCKMLQGHNGWVRSVVFSPNGHSLASGSEDGTIKFWNTQTSECIRTLRPPRPYEGMNITGATGLTDVQCETLKNLGAVEDAL